MSPIQYESLLDQPALSPPPGIEPQFDNPPSLKHAGFGITVTLLVLITLLFSMRTFVKVRINHHLALEDYLLLVSWVAYSGGFTAIAFLIADKHVGTHQWNLTVRQYIDFLKTFQVGSILYNIVVLPLKVAIALQMIRFFVAPGIRDLTFWISHMLIWINVVFYITATFMLIFACKPGNPNPNGRCLDTGALLISTASLNTISDALMLVLPQRVIWDLRMPLKRKLGLASAFLVALLALGSSVVRVYFAIQIKNSPDVSYNVGLLGLWSLPEMAIGFLIACLPYFPKFLRYMGRKPFAAAILAKWRLIFPSSAATSHKSDEPGAPPVGARANGRASRVVVTDIEFDELVARSTGSEILDRPDLVYHGPARWAQRVRRYRQEHPDEEWPPIEEASATVAYSAKEASPPASLASASEGVTITNNSTRGTRD
ncbi:hypothetical protein BU24DRAFT_463472 [Aaosphaeria arxii CBS 175.79]|uniref:Rhodopsin domain-containing protein n=1 Tax=Aaosphaeria arxii CBS 175.79 TaxID=1450172 RepID=A0A6A5XPQ8_9PLEO|nr:uncharacterized protein BU24DRAFT_463472 [Aaosphaeria arxii CBS 175.79]KAF2014710.1 hypothetical protein BU24DRAFT_463472 [Aaosphaeria arxii CBS 175.79]